MSRLRDLRKERKFSQVKMQMLTGVDQSDYSTYTLIKDYQFSKGTLDSLKHDRNISTATLDGLCRILNCKVEEVLVYLPKEQ